METSRRDRRAAGALRPLRAALGALDRADGSCHLSLGETRVLASVYGPIQSDQISKTGLTRLQSPKRGSCQVIWLEPEPGAPFVQTWTPSSRPAVLNGLSERNQFSSSEQTALRARVGGMRRRPTAESVLTRVFNTTILLEEYPLSSIYLVVHVLHDDGGAMATAIMASTLALMNAGISMRGFVVALHLMTLKQPGSTPPVFWLDPTPEELSQRACRSSLWVFDQEGGICFNRTETSPWLMALPSSPMIADRMEIAAEWLKTEHQTASTAAEKLCHWIRAIIQAQTMQQLPETQ